MKLTPNELKSWIDGELPEAEAQRIENELTGDEAAKREADFMRALGDEIRGLALDHPVRGAEDALDAVRFQVKKKFNWLKPMEFAALGLCTVIGFALIYPVFAGAKERAKNDSASELAVSKSVFGNAASAPASPPTRGGFGGAGGAPTMSEKGVSEAEFAQAGKAEYRRVGGLVLDQEESKAMMRQAPNQMDKASRVQGRGLLNDTQAAGANPSGMTTSEAHKYMRPQLIRSANMSVGVKSAIESRDQLQQMVESWGGFILTSNVQSGADESNAYLSVRVPEFNFEKALTAIRGMGKLLSESSQGQDVTAEVVDSKTRVEVLADEESNAVKRLNKARDERTRMVIRGELRSIRMQLQSYKAQVKNLEEMTKYSTLEVNLKQSAAGFGSDTWSDDAFGEASGMLGVIGKFAGRAGIFFVVLAPVWIPIVFAAWLIWRRNRA